MERTVTETGELLVTLNALFQDLSRKKIKNYLKGGAVVVNNKVVTQYNHIVKKGDIIAIQKDNKTHQRCPLSIIYEDDEFLVIDKPSGLLSVATPKEKEKTAYHMIRDFIKKRGRNEKIFILHRLDKDTSGVLVFVKNEKLKLALQKDWETLVTKREYQALIKGQIEDRKNYVCYLEENKEYQVRVVSSGGKKAITSFETIKTNRRYSLVRVLLKTGRKNQIRVVLSSLGHPVLGDKKYGDPKESAKRLYLHASNLSFQHPFTKKKYTFTSPLPAAFNTLIVTK